MAINVNRVYQAVLDIANKEQRGYITPKEFNVFANHVQDEIFTSYFHRSSTFGQGAPNDSEHSDPHDIAQEKIEYFEQEVSGSSLSVPNDTIRMKTPSDFYKTQTVMVDRTLVGIGGKGRKGFFTINEAEYVSKKELISLMGCKINRPTIKRPVYTFEGKKNDFIRVYGASGFPNNYSAEQGIAYSNNENATSLNSFNQPSLTLAESLNIPSAAINITYIRKPLLVSWGYTVIQINATNISNDHPIYNPGNSIDFEIHHSEFTNVVAKILILAGVKLKQADIAQVGKSTVAEQNQIMR
mgnify:FL=1|tara:strand:+ start:86 stop:979 length:894 start_codon:yes stop_codon:yes gene_type:complete